MKTKRQLDLVSETGPFPHKRGRRKETDTQQPGLDNSELELGKTGLQHPKPRAFASFPGDYVDPTAAYTPRINQPLGNSLHLLLQA
ncbi:hypothetical protein CDD83_2898 [Cordyceps sp. RAO-2017]|nr:hypothetical protein CDD83_2898 [Cordyceps sp. RAO-2017]